MCVERVRNCDIDDGTEIYFKDSMLDMPFKVTDVILDAAGGH